MAKRGRPRKKKEDFSFGYTGDIPISTTDWVVHDSPTPCPHCGYCPTCGRSNYQTPKVTWQTTK